MLTRGVSDTQPLVWSYRLLRESQNLDFKSVISIIRDRTELDTCELSYDMTDTFFYGFYSNNPKSKSNLQWHNLLPIWSKVCGQRFHKSQNVPLRGSFRLSYWKDIFSPTFYKLSNKGTPYCLVIIPSSQNGKEKLAKTWLTNFHSLCMDVVFSFYSNDPKINQAFNGITSCHFGIKYVARDVREE